LTEVPAVAVGCYLGDHAREFQFLLSIQAFYFRLQDAADHVLRGIEHGTLGAIDGLCRAGEREVVVVKNTLLEGEAREVGYLFSVYLNVGGYLCHKKRGYLLGVETNSDESRNKR
jgi:hypothetical protein